MTIKLTASNNTDNIWKPDKHPFCLYIRLCKEERRFHSPGVTTVVTTDGACSGSGLLTQLFFFLVKLRQQVVLPTGSHSFHRRLTWIRFRGNWHLNNHFKVWDVYSDNNFHWCRSSVPRASVAEDPPAPSQWPAVQALSLSASSLITDTKHQFRHFHDGNVERHRGPRQASNPRPLNYKACTLTPWPVLLQNYQLPQ